MARGDYNRTPQELQEKVIDLYLLEELGSKTISKKLGISKTTVLRILKKEGIKRRDLSSAGKILFNKGYTHPMKGKKHTKGALEKMKVKRPNMKVWNKGLTKKDDVRIKGGRISKGFFIGTEGYAYIYLNGKLQKAHRYLWEKENGKIPEGHIIHHIDGNKLNNNLSNLKLMSRSEHSKLHWMQNDIRRIH
jgi:hypothetical protein